MRYDYGVGIYNSGPYLPEFNQGTCQNCTVCVEKCPAGALSFSNNSMEINKHNCLGCGLCSAACRSESITMVYHEERARKDSEPGRIKLLIYMAYINLSMIPSVLLFKMIAGSKQTNMINAKPNENDYFHPSMQ